jgi:HSP20 family protein
MEENMTLYVTPFGRVARRSWTLPREIYRDDEWNQAEYEVFVPVDVKAGVDEYVLTALLPGVKSEDVSIQIVNETVTLQGEIKAGEDEKEGYLLRECPTGRFQRVIRLPEAVDTAQSSADLTDGVLTLRLPKVEEARPRTIKVNAK